MTDQAQQSDSTSAPMKSRVGYLVRFIAQPLMFLAAGVLLLALLGVAQRTGWITSSDSLSSPGQSAAAVDVDYICPMMCTPPQKEPGRCPVCAMELVAAGGGASGGDERSVVVDAATRRVVNIQTASVQRIPLQRTIKAVGEVGYDESKMKTISAYTTGRFEKMYVDYVGAVVQEGDRLASFYSPDMYSAQVEFLQAVNNAGRGNGITTLADANARLQSNATQRLVELGMSKQQIDQLRNGGKAASQFDVLAPMSGTVTDRLAVEGAYVQEGQPVFRLADLSTVWLQLKLFPNDASTVRIGQTVKAQLKSMPDQDIYGHIAFIDPAVNQASRTVSVRVVLDNESGNIRIGDYAKATVEAPVSQDIARDALVVPRNSILSAADHSIVYVETETGRFEIRRVITGPSNGPSTVITKGLAEGEKVATSGNFLIDSQMQLAGNPSLIDPSRAAPPLEMVAGFTPKELAEIQQLPDSEQSLAIEQIICPVTEYKLGSMGVPLKVEVDNQVVFICCLACKEDVLQDPQLHLAKIAAYKRDGPTDAQEVDAFEVPEIGEIEMIVD